MIIGEVGGILSLLAKQSKSHGCRLVCVCVCACVCVKDGGGGSSVKVLRCWHAARVWAKWDGCQLVWWLGQVAKLYGPQMLKTLGEFRMGSRRLNKCNLCEVWESSVHLPCTPCWRQAGTPGRGACCGGRGWAGRRCRWWPSSPCAWPPASPRPRPGTCPESAPSPWSLGASPWRWPLGAAGGGGGGGGGTRPSDSAQIDASSSRERWRQWWRDDQCELAKEPRQESKNRIIGRIGTGVLYQICWITRVNIELGEDSALACRHSVWCSKAHEVHRGQKAGKLAMASESVD